MKPRWLLVILLLGGFGGTSYGLTRQDLDVRLAVALRDSSDYQVVLDDVLGEGAGAWDSDPRAPVGKVNCMTWLQLVLARAYAPTPADTGAVLDRLRYYAGEPSFALRKHYIDHWLRIEPAPLRPVPLELCGSRSARVELEPERFTASKGFPCALFRMSEKRFDLRYVTGQRLERCIDALAPGRYVAFAVPSARYARRYLGASGPMGLVHSLVLEVDSREPMVFHASTAAGRVLHEPLGRYVEQMKQLHLGYSVYDLDPAWQPLAKPPLMRGMRALLQCEHALESSASR